MSERKLDEKNKLLVQLLIGSLDIDGYLRIPLEDLADFVKVSVFEIEEALHILWKMEPYGVGARNLRECILLQLRYQGLENTLAMRVVDETWELFEKLKIPEISRHFGVEPRQVQEALDALKSINPKPGYQYNPDKPSTIIPDLIVEKIDGKFMVMLNDRSVPSLQDRKSVV